MRIEHGFLRSKVARRIVALFVLCALVPIVATAVLSYDHVRKLLLDQSYLHLAQLGESYASSLYERLSGVSLLLRQVAPGTDAGAESWTKQRRDGLLAQVDALAVLHGDGRITAVLGSMRPFAPIADAERTYLAKGESVLRIHANPGAPATVLMVQAIDPRRPDADLVIAEMDPSYLWGEADALPAMTNFCVVGTSGELLFASQGQLQPVLAALAERLPRTPNGRIEYAAADGPEVASYRELFLESHFFVRGWTVVATQPEAEVLAPITAYKQSFLLATTLALLGIVLVSIAQIRRTLVPLEKLIEGTRRAANKDFNVRVDVGGNDEFGELARSFNTMTLRLGSQFTALSTLAEIDRAILARPDVVQVIEAVLRRIRAIVPAPYASIAILDRHPAGTMRVYTRGHGDAAVIDLVRVDADVDDASRLAAQTDGVWLDPAGAVPSYAAPLAKLGAAALFAVPVIWQGNVIGAIVVGADRRQLLTDDEEARIHDLADRIGVAFAAAAKDEQLYYHAHYDTLTGLPNRLFFRDQLERAIVRAERDKAELAVLFVDLDYFKHVNDTIGHAAGDDVLVEAADRMRRCLRSSDIVGRLGGDEFTILVTDLNHGQDAAVVAQNVIAAMSRPFMTATVQHFLSASIGIAIFPADGTTAEELVRNADTAMYRAKDYGRGQSVYFEERMNVAALARARTERDLRHALEHHDFYLVYQPIMNLQTGRISGAEALLRWNHPEHGTLAPTHFIQLAEETGLIGALGEWVLREACAEFCALRTQGAPLPSISINVSARQFKQANFAETVRKVLREAGMAGSSLEIEITESLLLDATPAVEGMLTTLSVAGVRIALDDFGTGYSSLAYLKRFPVDVVKIDRSFIKDLPADRSSAAIAGAIISMAHALEKRVVAEGVASAEQMAFLRELGCNDAQGFYLAKPLGAAELAAFIRSTRQLAGGDDVVARETPRMKPAVQPAGGEPAECGEAASTARAPALAVRTRRTR